MYLYIQPQAKTSLPNNTFIKHTNWYFLFYISTDRMKVVKTNTGNIFNYTHSIM